MSVVDTLGSKAVLAGLENPTLGRLLGMVSKDAKNMISFLTTTIPSLDGNITALTGLNEQQLRLLETGELKPENVKTLGLSPEKEAFALVYAETYKAAQQDIAKGLPALKSQSQSDLSTLPEVQQNGARKIAYAVASTVQENLPQSFSWEYSKRALSQTWSSATDKFNADKRPSPFEKPVEWISSLLSQTWDFVSTLGGGIVNVRSQAEALVKEDAAKKADKMAMDIGGKLTIMGMSRDVVGDAMIAAYERIQHSAGITTSFDKDAKKKEFLSQLETTQREAINKATRDRVEPTVQETLKAEPFSSQKPDAPTYSGVSGTASQIKDWLTSSGKYAGSPAVKESVYNTDLSEYGPHALSLDGFKTGLATMFSLSKRGEMGALKSHFEKSGKFTVGFHDAEGTLFDPSKLSSDNDLPKPVVISITDKSDTNKAPKLVVFEKEGFSMDTVDRAIMGAGQVGATYLGGAVFNGIKLLGAAFKGKQVATAVVATETATTVAHNSSRLVKAATAIKGELATVPVAFVAATGMDATSKALGGYSSELEYGEAFKAALMNGPLAKSLGGTMTKSTSSIPSNVLGGMLEKVRTGAEFTKDQLAWLGQQAINPEKWRNLVSPMVSIATNKYVLGGGAIYGAHQAVSASPSDVKPQNLPDNRTPQAQSPNMP